MANIEIQYCFRLNQGHQEVVDLCLDGQTLENINQPTGHLPAWTNLDFHQCRHCPLDPAHHGHCPVALSLVDIAGRFEKIVSYDEVGLTVVGRERTVSQQTTAQQAISSLLGLLFATSGCPHTQFLKPMARFHLPLATEEDTIFRAASMYLLAQYFRGREGRRQDLGFAGLTTIYDNLHQINIGIANRLRSAFRSDSSVNAVIVLDMFAKAMPYVVKDELEEIRYLFAPYFSDLFDDILESSLPESTSEPK
jgi:hypothetical protein